MSVFLGSFVEDVAMVSFVVLLSPLWIPCAIIGSPYLIARHIGRKRASEKLKRGLRVAAR